LEPEGGERVTTESLEEKVREVSVLLPPRGFTEPGPRSMSLDDAMNKIAVAYADALELLGKI
jgi:hypothetical protein